MPQPGLFDQHPLGSNRAPGRLRHYGLGLLLSGFSAFGMPASAAQAQASTLRVACDDSALGAEISVNGQFKGECPLDIQVKAGTLKVKAVKTIDGKQQVQVQNIRIGEGVSKRVEASFDAQSGTAAPSATVDPKAVALLRYEAELTEYNRNVNTCRPHFDDEVRKQRQEAREAFNEHKAACIERDGEYDARCGAWDSWSQKLLDRRVETQDNLDNLTAGNDPAGDWCRSQFSAPRKPE